jgi:hypothetical protein
LLTCLLRRGDNAKLLQQTEVVGKRPTFHHLAVGDAVDVDAG